MATISRETVQKLVVLRAIHRWSKGPFGALRVHNTLFFADLAATKKGKQVLFTYKKHTYGPYSDDICSALNRLQDSGLIKTQYDGTAARIVSLLAPDLREKIQEVFEKSSLRDWDREFQKSFEEWGFRTNEQLIRSAHDRETFENYRSGEVVLPSSLGDSMTVRRLSEDDAENLSLLVDENYQTRMVERVRILDEINALIENGEIPEGKDWRKDLFGESEQVAA